MNGTEIRDLAGLLAEVIRRLGAAYGSPHDWRRDFTCAVKIMERASARLKEEENEPQPEPSGMDEYGSLE